jgi:hypothetical protein
VEVELVVVVLVVVVVVEEVVVPFFPFQIIDTCL